MAHINKYYNSDKSGSTYNGQNLKLIDLSLFSKP